MFYEKVISNLDDYKIHQNQIKMLKMYNKDTIPNILLYGPKNSGKKNLIKNYIKYLFGLEKLDYTIKVYNIKINNNDVKITIKQSLYFLEIKLCEYGLYDKHVLCDFIKNIADNKSVTNNYRIIIVNDIGSTTKNAQLALRRMMETLVKSTRFFFTTNSRSNLDDAIVSRCYSIRIPLPNNLELTEHIKSLSSVYEINLTNQQINKIIKKSKRNLYLVNMLLIDDNLKYEDPINFIVKELNTHILNKNINFLEKIRTIIYKAHLLNYSTSDIIKSYLNYIFEKKIFTDHECMLISQEAALNEHQNCIGKKPFYNLEKLFIFIKRIVIQKK